VLAGAGRGRGVLGCTFAAGAVPSPLCACRAAWGAPREQHGGPRNCAHEYYVAGKSRKRLSSPVRGRGPALRPSGSCLMCGFLAGFFKRGTIDTV